MTIEQMARDLLERLGVEDAQSYTTGDLVELANLIADNQRLRAALLTYGQHKEDCGKDFSKGWPPIVTGKCTCGFSGLAEQETR